MGPWRYRGRWTRLGSSHDVQTIAATYLQAMAGGDTQDPGSAGKSFYYFPQYARKTSILKFGYSPLDFNDFLEEPYRPVFAKGA